MKTGEGVMAEKRVEVFKGILLCALISCFIGSLAANVLVQSKLTESEEHARKASPGNAGRLD